MSYIVTVPVSKEMFVRHHPHEALEIACNFLRSGSEGVTISYGSSSGKRIEKRELEKACESGELLMDDQKPNYAAIV
jgi:hypothetical protein